MSQQQGGIQSFLCYFPLRRPTLGHWGDQLGTKETVSCAWHALHTHNHTSGLEAARWWERKVRHLRLHFAAMGAEVWEVQWHALVTADGQQQDRVKIRPFSFQPGFSSPCVCPALSTAGGRLQKGYKQNDPRESHTTLGISWDFRTCVHIIC